MICWFEAALIKLPFRVALPLGLWGRSSEIIPFMVLGRAPWGLFQWVCWFFLRRV